MMTAILQKLDIAIQKQLSDCRRFSIAMALVSCDGLATLAPAFEKCLKRTGAQGQLLFGIDLPTNPDAIASLMELADFYEEKFTLRRFESGNQGVFHSKLYLFASHRGSKTAILGSSNLTRGGLCTNVEANVFVDDVRTVGSFWDNFDEHFEGGHAKDVDTKWLEKYRKIWQEEEELYREWQKSLDKARNLPSKKRPGERPTPERIQGHTFLFTGGIPENPRRALSGDQAAGWSSADLRKVRRYG